MTNEQKRKDRIDEIAKGIKSATRKYGIVDKEKLIAQIMINFGTSRRTTLEYINVLIRSGLVDDFGKTIKWAK